MKISVILISLACFAVILAHKGRTRSFMRRPAGWVPDGGGITWSPRRSTVAVGRQIKWRSYLSVPICRSSSATLMV